MSSIDGDAKEYASIVKTCDMLNFARVSFNKAIKTAVTSFSALESQYPLVSLSDKERFSISIGKRVLGTETDENGDIPVFSAMVKLPLCRNKNNRGAAIAEPLCVIRIVYD